MRWILIVLVAMFGGSLLYVGGPGFFGGGSPEQEALARPVAEVNGTTITSAELQSVYRNNLALYRRLFGQVQPGQNDEIMYRSLDAPSPGPEPALESPFSRAAPGGDRAGSS